MPQTPRHPTQSVDLPAPVEAGLGAVESLLDALDADLVAGAAPDYERHCTELKHALLDLQSVLNSAVAHGDVVSKRLQGLGVRLSRQRDHMARRSVTVDRQLEFMLPGLTGATYTRTTGAYGSGQRVAGKFTSIKA